MASVGSAEWCEEELAWGGRLPERPGCDGSLSFTATGGPDGDVAWHLHLGAGRLIAVAPGADAEAEVAVTLPWADAEAIFAGDLDANAAYMQGRLKSTGATGPLLRWLSVMKVRSGERLER